jgi:hypothetical protein
MTEQLVEPAAALEIPTDAEPTRQIAAPAPVVITEGEVLLSTAAAVHPRPTSSGRARRGLFAARRRTPSRLRFLDHSVMEREMHRL